MTDFSKRKLGVVLVVCLFICMLPRWADGSNSMAIFNKMDHTLSSVHRKLLSRLAIEEPNRIWGEKCTNEFIQIEQRPIEPLASGIPAFTVIIMNRCGTGCNISNIHLCCGWFSSNILINPKIFKRLGYNDCLINDGKPLLNGAALTFVYANSFSYTLSVSSIVCS